MAAVERTGEDQNVRDAAVALMIAIGEAKAAGYVVQWPRRPEELVRISISETARVVREPVAKKKAKKATVTNLDGTPVERDTDSMIVGEPLDITDEDRARLPALGDLSEPGSNAHGQMSTSKSA